MGADLGPLVHTWHRRSRIPPGTPTRLPSLAGGSRCPRPTGKLAWAGGRSPRGSGASALGSRRKLASAGSGVQPEAGSRRKRGLPQGRGASRGFTVIPAGAPRGAWGPAGRERRAWRGSARAPRSGRDPRWGLRFEAARGRRWTRRLRPARGGRGTPAARRVPQRPALPGAAGGAPAKRHPAASLPADPRCPGAA